MWTGTCCCCWLDARHRCRLLCPGGRPSGRGLVNALLFFVRAGSLRLHSAAFVRPICNGRSWCQAAEHAAAHCHPSAAGTALPPGAHRPGCADPWMTSGRTVRRICSCSYPGWNSGHQTRSANAAKLSGGPRHERRRAWRRHGGPHPPHPSPLPRPAASTAGGVPGAGLLAPSMRSQSRRTLAAADRGRGKDT